MGRKRKTTSSNPSGVASSSTPVSYTGSQSVTQSRRRASVLASARHQQSLCDQRCESYSSNYAFPGVRSQAFSSVFYDDLGDCSYVCEFCNALFWYSERVIDSHSNRRPKYSICCREGNVMLQYPTSPPSALRSLFLDSAFKSNIRKYNSMFAMTSFGAKLDKEVNDGYGPYVFKISGQVSHRIGSICPPPQSTPAFLQLYIYDTENEVSNRLSHFSKSGRNDLSPSVVALLSRMLNSENQYVKLFKTSTELCLQDNIEEFGIRLYSGPKQRCYDSPTFGILGAIVYGEDCASNDFDVIVHSKDGKKHRVDKRHPSYMPLQYPLLFPYGEQGWSSDLRLPNNRKLSMNMYYSFQIHDRQDIHTHVLSGGRLFQQYVVDAYVCVEQYRLDYIRDNQSSLRTDILHGIQDAVSRGDTQGHEIGKRIILPSSFTGGPRYMYKHYQDALAICRVHGKPQYFITFTCNVNWPEIQRELSRHEGLTAQDRPDIIARVFQMKVESFLKFIKSDRTFGEVTADLYTIEFQKRGLPHCHILIWVAANDRINGPADIDKYITAEIPDSTTEPELYHTISESMMHGPCGLLGKKSPCMVDGKCSKGYPKPYEHATRFDDEGYVYYKRRKGATPVMKNGKPLDNGYVVPYNKTLCLRFNAHINVEYCGWSMLIKYLFKYISKGTDRIRFSVSKTSNNASTENQSQPQQIDEIENYVDGRFICPHEASWRLLNFPIHHRNPAVQVLAVHLPNMQSVTFRAAQRLGDIISNSGVGKTTLTEWLKNNQIDHTGRELRYVDYQSEYRWEAGKKRWLRRTSNRTPSIGRLSYIHPACGESFYLRLLLTHQKGCRTFEEIRTVSNIVQPTYRTACEKLGLIGGDKEWMSTFQEASVWATAVELRTLFAHMLLFCDISNPLDLWEQEWEKMSDDILYRLNNDSRPASVRVPPSDLQQHVLFELEVLLKSSSRSCSLADFGLPMPNPSLISLLNNRLIIEERSYDREKLAAEHNTMRDNLRPAQRVAYNAVMQSLEKNSQILLFIYGHGGTGKTYLWNTIIAGYRSVGKIVLAVAASGIASLLLPGGRTAHSRFKIPIDLKEESVCDIKKKTILAQLLIETRFDGGSVAGEWIKRFGVVIATKDRTILEINQRKSKGVKFNGCVIINIKLTDRNKIFDNMSEALYRLDRFMAINPRIDRLVPDLALGVCQPHWYRLALFATLFRIKKNDFKVEVMVV